ncbi:MAG: FAD-dependent oxidoreductase [Acidimicrobiia bacterium]|nr:FAD-dependent oxidoreductase [Acidimicrobiia bacterium]
MSNHAPRLVERHCDVAVVGGSAAGLAAALQLGRQRRSVIVIDAGEPRNATSGSLHGYLGHDGIAPSQFAATAREEVRRYGGEVLAGRVVEVARRDGQFRLELTGGHGVVARRVLAATGVIDELPDIDGVRERWGSDVIHCPFCHGYEARDRAIAQVVTHPMGLHAAGLFRQLTDQFTVVLDDDVDVESARLDALRAAGVGVIHGRARGIVVDDGDAITGVELTDGQLVAAEVVAVTPRTRAGIEAFTPIGLRTVPLPSGLGDVVEIDATGATEVDGVFAAGNLVDPSQQVAQAAADGARVGAMISFSLADEDIEDAARPSAHQADWDHRYGSDPVWSGNPNGTLVHEVAELAPGRALDVGAGEGGDAIWLAEQGWHVTAADISAAAVARVTDEAERRGVEVTCRHVDANAVGAFEPDAFDLVSAQYASIPRTPDGRAVTNLLAAVAPGGTLLVVGHDLEPMRAPVDTRTTSRAFDPDAYVRVDDVAAVLAGLPEWDIEHHEKRPRPPGSATAAHHVDDIVLRARRRVS